MSAEAIEPRMPISSEQARYLIATAARAPSIHNSQPWRFRVSKFAIELYADPERKLGVDPLGRELLISCGAALFGLRLAIRSIGYQPLVRLLPDRSQLRLLATITLGLGQPPTPLETQLLEAMPHRHTHRGPFAADVLPAGLVAALQHDALAEGARLAPISRGAEYQRLADIRRWTREQASNARDGVPATAFPVVPHGGDGRLRQRDFDLGRGLGQLEDEGQQPAATFALLTMRDGRADWLRAGQALHRVLVHAASAWVFAGIYTQPLEAAAIRALIRARLELPGAPQTLLQLGVARTTRATARRPATDIIDTV